MSKLVVFNEKYFTLSNDIIELKIIGTYDEERGALPYYWWNIFLKSKKIKIGSISLRLGHNYHSYYNGNIGYEIDEEFRGNHYALLACQLVIFVAKKHNMNKLYLSCNYDNIPSCKTIEKLGGVLLEEVIPPKNYIYYYEGIKRQRIYELVLE